MCKWRRRSAPGASAAGRGIVPDAEMPNSEKSHQEDDPSKGGSQAKSLAAGDSKMARTG